MGEPIESVWIADLSEPRLVALARSIVRDEGPVPFREDAALELELDGEPWRIVMWIEDDRRLVTTLRACGEREASMLGSPLSDAPGYQAGYTLYGQVEAQTQASILNYLTKTGGKTLSDAQGAVKTIANLGTVAAGALRALHAQSAGEAIGDITPLIAAGLSAASVNPLVGAAVLAGVGLAEILADLFSTAAQQCDYTVGNVCFHSASHTYGPSDPNWIPIEAFIRGWSWKNIRWELTPNVPAGPNTAPNEAFLSWWQTIGLELYVLGDRSAPALDWAQGQRSSGSDPDQVAAGIAPSILAQIDSFGALGRKFFLAFDLAFVKLQEMPINGLAPIHPTTLIDSVIAAWNGSHAGPPKTLSAQSTPAGQTSLLLEQLLAGAYDRQSLPPVQINTGPERIVLHLPPPSTTSSSASTGLVVAGATAVAAGGLWLLLGRPLTLHAFKAAARHILGRARG